MKTSRERILKRLRTAAPAGHFLPSQSDGEIFVWQAGNQAEAITAFADKLALLKAEFYRVANTHEAATQLQALLMPLAHHDHKEAGRPQFLRHASVLLEEIMRQEPWLQANIAVQTENIAAREFAHFKAGITTVESLVARTGSIVVSSAGNGGRRLSVLPPFHIAIATLDQLVDSLDDAIANFRKSGRERLTSVLTVITGPSRTADIEKILVLGAHGPKRLAVILVG